VKAPAQSVPTWFHRTSRPGQQSRPGAPPSPFPFLVAACGTNRVQMRHDLLLLPSFSLHYPSPSRCPDSVHYGGGATAGPGDHSPTPHHLSPHGSGGTRMVAIQGGVATGSARCRTAKGRTVLAPNSEVVQGAVGSVAQRCGADRRDAGGGWGSSRTGGEHPRPIPDR
jgi:hypothetical protein